METIFIKTGTLIGVFALVLTLAGSPAAQTAFDLSERRAIYFTGANKSIDLKNDKFVIGGGTMEIPASAGTNCADGFCEFNFGFIAFRSGNTREALSSYGLFQVERGGLVGNTIYFAAGETSKQGVHAVGLRPGATNKVTFTIDPYGKAAESNESNNSVTVYIKVTGSKN